MLALTIGVIAVAFFERTQLIDSLRQAPCSNSMRWRLEGLRCIATHYDKLPHQDGRRLPRRQPDLLVLIQAGA